MFAALQEAALSTAAPGAVFRPLRADSPDAVCALLYPEALSHQGSSTGVQKAVSVRTESQAAGWHTEVQVF